MYNKEIANFIGIIKGINADGIINETEVDFLKKWVSENDRVNTIDAVKDIVVIVNDVLEDNVIDEEERKRLTALAEKLNEAYSYSSNVTNQLDGILSGIVCDEIINEEEAKSLQKWFDNNSHLNETYMFKKIVPCIEKVLEDDVLTADESEELKELIKEFTLDVQETKRIVALKRKIKERKNLGNDLIEISSNEELKNKIINIAKSELSLYIYKFAKLTEIDTAIVFLALCILGLDKYDGNYWEDVLYEFNDVFGTKIGSDQKRESILRDIIKIYFVEEEGFSGRYINYVLENTLVPITFLGNYFEFMFDIYNINFENSLDGEDLEEDMHFVFEGLKNNFDNSNDDSLKVEVTNKSYKLIKTCKDVISKGDSLEELIELSTKVLKIIDDFWWSGEEELAYNSYYKHGLQEWVKKIEKEKIKLGPGPGVIDRNAPNRIPSFSKSGDMIYINIPDHKIKKDYDWEDVRIELLENGKVIQTIDKPHISEIFGGYKLHVEKIRLDNPLSNIRYKVYCGEEIIFDSKDKLYKNYIVFDDNGRQLPPNKEYNGQVDICYKPTSKIESSIVNSYTNPNGTYLLGYCYVKTTSRLQIDDSIITFCAKIEEGLEGEKNGKAYILKDKKKYVSYKNVKTIVFESQLESDKLGIKINDKRQKLSEMDIDSKQVRDKYYYFVNLELEDNSLYEIECFEIETRKVLKKTKHMFAIDSKLKINTEKIDNSIYDVSIESGFDLKCNVYEIELPDLETIFEGDGFSYMIPLDVPLYNYRSEGWKPFDEYIWCGDINSESQLVVRGIEFDEIKLATSDMKIITKFSFNTKDDEYFVDLSALKTYKDTYEKMNLLFSSENTDSYSTYSNYKKIDLIFKICSCDLTIDFDKTTKETNCHIEYLGQGELNFDVKTKDGEIISHTTIHESPSDFKIDNMPVLTLLQFVLSEEPELFSLDDGRIVFSKYQKFYTNDGLIDKAVKIYMASYDKNVHGRFRRFETRLHGTYVHITKLIEENDDGVVFEGEIYRMSHGMKTLLNKVNPVSVEFTSEITNGIVEAAITCNQEEYEGEGLFFDKVNETILNNMDSRTASDIFAYDLNLNKMKTWAKDVTDKVEGENENGEDEPDRTI